VRSAAFRTKFVAYRGIIIPLCNYSITTHSINQYCASVDSRGGLLLNAVVNSKQDAQLPANRTEKNK